MRSLLLLAAVLLLPGCLMFEEPISGPSRSVNTWLLGVWEYPKPNGEILQAVVVPPNAGHGFLSSLGVSQNNNHYLISFRELTKNRKVKSSRDVTAWISRIGLVSFLTVEVDGQYLPVHFQLLSPVEVRLRLPAWDEGSESMTPFELRKQVRRKFKEGTLLAKDGETWTKVSEIYWPRDSNVLDQPTDQPLRSVPLPLEVIKDTEVKKEEVDLRSRMR